MIGTEKADALARLATLIDGILHPRENVLPMAGARGALMRRGRARYLQAGKFPR